MPVLKQSIKSILSTTLLCAAMGSAPIHAGGDPQHQVSIKDFKFIPPEITIKAGDSIRWTNNEKRQYHSVWFEKAGDPEPGYFFPDETYERTFNEPGTYPYRCGPHPEMTGIVTVE